jgi:hypothetical protein
MFLHSKTLERIEASPAQATNEVDHEVDRRPPPRHL